MGELPDEEETLEIDEPSFECLVCGREIEFNFEESEGKIEPGEVSEEVEEEIGSEEIPSLEGGGLKEAERPELEMKIICDCGAEYIVKKRLGEPGFIVNHEIESEPELAEKEFEEDVPPE